MDALLRNDAICLGGPNWNPESIGREILVRNGWNSTEIEIILKEDCRVRFTDYGLQVSPLYNLTWSKAGISEQFLERKLRLQHIHSRYGNLAFANLILA